MSGTTTCSIPKKSLEEEEKVLEEEDEKEEVDPNVKPEFIFGGPFLAQVKPEPYINSITPINLPLQGTFKQSFAHYFMKEKIPKILGQLIDYMTEDATKIRSTGASEDEIKKAVQAITKLRSEIEENRAFTKIKPRTLETIKWNDYIRDAEPPRYFTCGWAFSECYIYRKLREPFETSDTMKKFDPFGHLKKEALQESIEPMCVVANRVADMVTEQSPDMISENIMLLLKVCLWANKQDLAFNSGSGVNLHPDPIQMVADLKNNLLVDDSKKAVKTVCSKALKTGKDIAKNTTFKQKCSCTRLAEAAAGKKGKGKGKSKSEDEKPPPREIPCPSKMKLPSKVMFDIVCDNAGYELFTDLCLAYFLIKMEIVEMIRLHVKQIPWFVSDATPTDVQDLIKFCMNARFEKEIPAPPVEIPEGEAVEENTESEEPPSPTYLTADKLNELGEKFNEFITDEKFLLQSDDFWVSPCLYKDMKTCDPHLYRKLQFAVAILFKGDLNYRKLVGEINYIPTTPFTSALEGFQPAPIIAVRTIKSQTVCGLTEAALAKVAQAGPEWMQTGDFGVIQFFAKADKLKVSDKPCVDFGWRCKGYICPRHKEL